MVIVPNMKATMQSFYIFVRIMNQFLWNKITALNFLYSHTHPHLFIYLINKLVVNESLLKIHMKNNFYIRFGTILNLTIEKMDKQLWLKILIRGHKLILSIGFCGNMYIVQVLFTCVKGVSKLTQNVFLIQKLSYYHLYQIFNHK